ncbi:hypothetical protein ACFE04_007378 [Oxalis oulophora]
MGDFTIQISNNLVDRLTDDGKNTKKKTKKPKAKISREPQPKLPQSKPALKKISDDSEIHRGPAAAGWPIQPPLFLPVPPPVQTANAELEAIRSVLQESKDVIEKLQKQEETMVQEVTERAKDLRDKEFKIPTEKPMPCVAQNNAWQACYKEHITDPLKCAHLARSFADCARKVRQQAGLAEK